MERSVQEATPEKLAKLMAIGLKRKAPINERFVRERAKIFAHYQNALETLTEEQIGEINSTPQTKAQLRKAVTDYIEDKGLFEPTDQDYREAENPNFSDAHPQETAQRWKDTTIRTVVRLFR